MPGPGDNLLHNRSLCAAVSEKNEHNTAAGSCLTAPSMSFCHISRNYGDRILSQKVGAKTEMYSFWLDGLHPHCFLTWPLKQKEAKQLHMKEPFLQ